MEPLVLTVYLHTRQALLRNNIEHFALRTENLSSDTKILISEGNISNDMYESSLSQCFINF